jgi:ankyrin repeat protein
MSLKKNEALFYSAGDGDLAKVQSLISEGVDVNAVVQGQTPIHAAVTISRHTYRDDVLEALVAAGADIDALNEDECTPLMVAATIGKVYGSKMALKLITLGADVLYVRKSDSATALRFAVTRATQEVLNAIIDRGGLVDGPNGSPITPLMKAVVENNLESAKTLVARGADLSIKCTLPWAKGKTAEEIAVQEKRKAIADFLRKKRESSEA